MALKPMRCNIITILLWLLITFYLALISIKLDGKLVAANILIGQMETDFKQLNEKIAVINNLVNKMKRELEEKKEKMKLMNEKCGKPTLSSETFRRRISNYLREIWYYVSSQSKRIDRILPGKEKQHQTKLIENFRELNQATEVNFEAFVSLDKSKVNYQNRLAEDLSSIIQKRLYKLQNPKNCKTARKLVCSLEKSCGYGCQVHHLLYCFIIAYSTKRTMFIDSKLWKYSKRGWHAYFKPISTNCTINFSGDYPSWSMHNERYNTIHLPIISRLKHRPNQLPLAVPIEFYDRISLFHGHPFVWWIGQFGQFLFSYQPHLKSHIERKKAQLRFEKPIVGVQIRRTDKINSEAAYHHVEEYMYWVDLYYKKLGLKQEVKHKRVFLATDDAQVFEEIKLKYPDYIFLSDDRASIYASDKDLRYSEISLRGVISDIELLSESDYLVCTFSSQVCRLAYEMMNGKHTDASDRFQSLDDIYYFGGQQEHNVKAVRSHVAKEKSSEISFEVGDVVKIAGNHWNGEAKGFHHKSRKTGLFPAYKVEDLHDKAVFPHYNEN